MSYHVCEMFNSLYSQLPDDDNEEMRKSGRNLLYETYCPTSEEGYQKCNSNSEHISAGFVYLVSQLFGNVNSEGEHEDQKKYYVYYGFLWMSYKLQQSNIKSDQPIGLYDFLNKHIVNGDWYDVIEEYVQPKISMITEEADIVFMSEIYYILKEMCKFFSINNDSLDRFEDFSKYYDSVIKFGENILKKKSNNADIDNVDLIYVDLYDMLKNVYNDYRDYHYGKNSHYNPLLEIPDIEEIKKNVTHDLETSDLQDNTKGTLEPQDGDRNSEQQQPVQQSSSEPKLKEPAPPQSKQTLAPKPPERPPEKPSTVPSSQPKPKSEAKQQQASQQKASQSQTVEPVQSTDQQQTGPLPAVPPSQDGGSLQAPKTGEIHQNGQGGTVDRKGETSGGSGAAQDSQGGSSDGSGDGQGSGVHGSRGAGGGPSDSKSGQNDSESRKGNKDSGANGGGSTQGDQGNPSVGSSDPASSTSGGSFGFGPSFLEFIFNGTNQFNKASEFIEKNLQSFKDAKDKINNAYNDAMDNLKSVYSASSDYFNSVISNITSQLNQGDTPSKSGGNQTGSGSPIGGGGPSNQLQSPQPPNTTDPSTPTKDPPPAAPTDPSTPTKDPPPAAPTDPSTPTKDPPPAAPTDPSKGLSSNPTPSSTPDPPKIPLQQKQSLFQSQSITQQPTQNNSSNQQTFGQFVKSLSSDLVLKKPWNIFPTTWNGSGDCKPEIKFINTTLVCCTSEQCSLTGILITLVLIPIILSIAYKYLSFGSSKKSEKKNMKRVINFHDGNRKTKIIICSNDRNKYLKPVINSVGGKKNSLLNIYKIIQADPMPFINLFFLLIFFVYKRKRDTIE
ncbi:CIR protein PIR protein [Plasmodium vinckei brucechwatti]|uniref:CIR protein PIR protein n=1 Tax=Plasmodium vinckei brucechwatti TaxID=119398 RepID=A0A6V7S4Q8_PLAVN|nr:CIR protein PIR protein [Plasmodium vinckei brucechwatti]